MKAWAILLGLLALVPGASAERLGSLGPAPPGYTWFKAEPAKDWDAAWAIGEPMFRKLRLVFPE